MGLALGMGLVNRLLPEEPLERLTEALLVGQRHLHSFGITAWQDDIVGSYGDAGDPGPAYLKAAADGTLTARVVGAICSRPAKSSSPASRA